jgi:hypothetical protein
MAHWYYGEKGVQHGPVDESRLVALIREGQVQAATQVWREGMTAWKSLAEVQAQGELVEVGLASSPYQSPSPQNAQNGTPSYPVAVPAPTSGLAIASLVCGIVCLVSCLVFLGIPAVICGHLALSQIGHSATPLAGRGIAMAGLVMGYLGVLATLAMVVMFVAAALGA